MNEHASNAPHAWHQLQINVVYDASLFTGIVDSYKIQASEE
jgi:hypothetical protein